MPTPRRRIISPLDPGGLRALAVGAGAAFERLRALGARTELAADDNAALLALIGADVILDPFRVVTGASPELAARIAGAPLLHQPALLAEGELTAATLAALAPQTGASAIVIDGVDCAAGLLHVGGDRVFYLRLLGRFLTALAPTPALLRTASGAELMHCAHALCGSAAGIGAAALQLQAATLEQHIKYDGGARDGEAEALAAALERLLVAIGAALPAAARASGSGKCDAACQNKLMDMLAAFDGEANDLFEQCRQGLAALMPEAVLNRLAGHLGRYEFEAARALLELHLPKTE